MTYLEKYLQEHPHTDPRSLIIDSCPHWYSSLNATISNHCYESDDACEKCWNRHIPGTEPDDSNVVNHPKHYGREGAMECIDEMILVFGNEAVMNFCLMNTWKYRYRAADKNGAEDIAKSDWYMAKYAELKGGDRA